MSNLPLALSRVSGENQWAQNPSTFKDNQSRRDVRRDQQMTNLVIGGTDAPPTLSENEFRVSEAPPGSVLLVGDAAVFNVEGTFCATQAKCTHRQGPLSKGKLDGSTVTCPLHGSQFNVCTGEVLRGPATDPLKLTELFWMAKSAGSKPTTALSRRASRRTRDAPES